MIAEVARRYLGVPYRHRGRKAKALDCAGLIVRTYSDLGVTLPDLAVYGREPANDGLMDAMRAAFGPEVTGAPQPDDVIVLAFDGRTPHHMGFVGIGEFGRQVLIHCGGFPEIKCVVEQPLDERLLAMVVAIFRRPI